jgi:hypothetical protein
MKRIIFGLYLYTAVVCAIAVCGCAQTSSVLTTVGVKGKPADPAGLIDAANYLWTTVYGRPDIPPQVLVVQGDDLTCVDPNSQQPGFPVFMTSGASCREGYTLLPFAVSIAYHNQPWHSSALAHEYEHEILIRSGRTGKKSDGSSDHLLGDPNHTLDVWAAGGVVDQANAALALKGW